jgi:L,D-transpeptidase ErfK/SrfK
MKFLRLLPALIALSLGSNAIAEDGSAYSNAVIGGIFPYSAQSGERLTQLASQFGVSSYLLAKHNKLERTAPLKSGEEVWIDNMHIVPEWLENGIVVNLPQRMLFYFKDGQLAAAFPVGLGKPDWPTPTGSFKVVDLQTDKEWIVPESIQAEMRDEGKEVITRVPPGPENPLGRHWIGLSAWGYGIHGTIVPTSIYGFVSHGCIRALPEDIEKLSSATKVGTKVVSTYRTTLLAETKNGHIFAEVHPDTYKHGIDPVDELQKLAQDNRLMGRINWQRAFEVAQRQDGLATDVTLIR